MKRKLILFFLGLVVAGSAWWGLRSYSLRMWERMLMGPFAGIAYDGSLSPKPASALQLDSIGVLEVHEIGSTNPVVALRSPEGIILWSRWFVPERRPPGGPAEYAGVRDLRLNDVEQRENGISVYVVCSWDWGGREGGLIQLRTNGQFESFSLSW